MMRMMLRVEREHSARRGLVVVRVRLTITTYDPRDMIGHVFMPCGAALCIRRAIRLARGLQPTAGIINTGRRPCIRGKACTSSPMGGMIVDEVTVGHAALRVSNSPCRRETEAQQMERTRPRDHARPSRPSWSDVPPRRARPPPSPVRMARTACDWSVTARFCLHRAGD